MATGAQALEQADIDQLIAAWSQDWKGRPRNGHTSHMVLSFPDDVSQDAAFVIAQEWCAEMFESGTHSDDTWEYVAALHTDTPHPHVHIVLNNRGFDGQWFSISSEGVFNPQMMRDRMTDIADDYGVRLESLTRADRGLYKDPITSAEIHAARQGRVLDAKTPSAGLPHDWRVQDVLQTAELYTTLAEFAEVIGAPMFAKRAHLSSAALFAGQQVPKGSLMSIDLDVTADREDIRTTLIGWVEQNRDAIEDLPDEKQHDIMGKIDAALTIIETDVTHDLTEETVWEGYGKTPSDYMIHNADAVEARAARYVAEEHVEALNDFVENDVLDRYLVTGTVHAKHKPALAAVAEAYAEMHGHALSDIPKEMTEYVRQAGNAGLDAAEFRERLIQPITDPIENTRMERQDITTIAQNRTFAQNDPETFAATMKTLEKVAADSVNHGVVREEDIFANLVISMSQAKTDHREVDRQAAWAKVSDDLFDLTAQDARGDLTARQSALLDIMAPAIYVENKINMQHANVAVIDHAFKVADADRAIQTPDTSSDDLYAELKDAAEAKNSQLDAAMAPYEPNGSKARIKDHRQAAQVYDALQDGLSAAERRIIEKGTVYNRDGLARVMQNAARTAATTGRADYANSDVSRSVLKGFVALEGKDAMAELATGNMDPLAEYLDTPASRRLVARELLMSAKQVDVGLGVDEIETGLEAVDPNYARSRGLSI